MKDLELSHIEGSAQKLTAILVLMVGQGHIQTLLCPPGSD